MIAIKRALLPIAAIASPALYSAQAIADEQGWQFSIAPLYIWAKNVEGSSSAGGKSSPLSLDFRDDILEHLDTAIAIHAEATNGTWTYFFEYNDATLKPSAEYIVGDIEFRRDVDFGDTLIEGGVTWTFHATDATRWELLAGLRYLKQDLKVKRSNSLPGDGPLLPRISIGDSWMHPIVGARVTHSLSQRWSFRVRGDYGYEGSDNSSFNGLAVFDYRFRDWGSVFAGYRYLDIDFDNGDSDRGQYGFDGDQQGPVMGLNFYL